MECKAENCRMCRHFVKEMASYGETEQYGILNKCEKHKCIIIDFKPCVYFFRANGSKTEIEARFSTFMSEPFFFLEKRKSASAQKEKLR